MKFSSPSRPASAGFVSARRRRHPIAHLPRSSLALLGLFLLLAGCGRHSPQAPDTVFVSNEGSNVVHVLEGAAGTVEGQLATGLRPRGMALSADGRTLYVAASNSNRIDAWDVRSRKRLRLFNSGSDPERFVISPDGKRLYIANEDKSAVSFIDLASGRTVGEVKVGPEPEGMGVSPDGRLVVATSEAANTAHFIDTGSAKLIDSVPVGSRPRDVLFLDGGRRVWVSSEQRGTISVFDSASRRIVHTIDLVPAFPDVEQVQAVEMKASRDGKRVFVAMGRSNKVAEIDPERMQVVRSFPTGQRTWGIALSPDGRRLYAASGLSGDLTIVDLAANKVLRTVKLGGKPWGVVAAPR